MESFSPYQSMETTLKNKTQRDGYPKSGSLFKGFAACSAEPLLNYCKPAIYLKPGYPNMQWSYQK